MIPGRHVISNTKQEITAILYCLIYKISHQECPTNAVAAIDRTSNSPKVVQEKPVVDQDSLRVQTKARSTDIMQQLKRAAR
jgi:hypothetical protein